MKYGVKLLLTGVLSINFITLGWANSFTVGSLVIKHPFARATPAGAVVGGGYLTITNTGEAERLISASSPGAGRVELHSHTVTDGVMRMREVSAIEVPARGEVALKPGGFHLMFFELKAPLKVGDKLPVKLKFQKAGEIEVVVNVEKMAAGAAATGHEDHSSHKH